MKKIIGNILKRIVFAFSIIYGINILLKQVGVFIPINIVNVLITTILGIPGLLSIFVIFYLIK